jgi:hypothetical protein
MNRREAIVAGAAGLLAAVAGPPVASAQAARASGATCPYDSKRARPDVRERIPTLATAHFERYDLAMICETVH